MRVTLAALFIFFFTVASVTPFSQAADPVPAVQQAKLKRLEEQLDRLKAAHAKMLENQAKIKSELETLRVWIRRQS